MDIDVVLKEGWRDHEKDTAGVAGRLEEAVALLEKPEHVGGLVQLGNHAIGQHLRDWPRAARLADAAFRRLDGKSPTAGLLALLGVAHYLSGDVAGGLAAEGRAAALPPADAAGVLLRTRLLVSEALFGMERHEEAYPVLDAALDLAETLPKESPVHRVAAVSLNNTASMFLERSSRTPEEDARMLRAARAARTHWLRVGTWENDERADHLLARVSNAVGNPADGVLHAARGLTTIEKNGEEPVDAAFLSLELSRSYGALGLKEPAAAARAKADAFAAGFDDPDLETWYAGEVAKGT